MGWGWWYPGWWWWGPMWAPSATLVGGLTSWTVVDTDVSPEHALVYLDGKLIGTADDFDGFPDYLYLKPPGRYQLEFRLPGYEPAQLTVDAAENHFVPVDRRLNRVAGERRGAWYERPSGLPVGRVFEKDEPTTGTDAKAPSSPSDRHEAPRPDPSLRPELAQPAQAPVQDGSAVLVLVVKPESAAVYLDGRFLGTAGELARLERGVTVAPGRLVVTAFAPGFAPRELALEVEKGSRQQVVIELEPARDGGARQNRTEVL